MIQHTFGGLLVQTILEGIDCFPLFGPYGIAFHFSVQAGGDGIHLYVPVCRFGMVIADVCEPFIAIFCDGGFESIVYFVLHSFSAVMKSNINSI